MEKPTNNHLWRCARYYFALCLAQGQSSDTVRSKTYALKKFCKWCFARNVRRIDDVDIALMDEYMAYLNAYRKSLDGQPLCAANKYALILCIKSFVKKMFNRGVNY